MKSSRHHWPPAWACRQAHSNAAGVQPGHAHRHTAMQLLSSLDIQAGYTSTQLSRAPPRQVDVQKIDEHVPPGRIHPLDPHDHVSCPKVTLRMQMTYAKSDSESSATIISIQMLHLVFHFTVKMIRLYVDSDGSWLPARQFD